MWKNVLKAVIREKKDTKDYIQIPGFKKSKMYIYVYTWKKTS